uniref:Uncharacterized protein n=1 Tax=Anguilla anguilla TaxID=7936 RepID=A0A0E9P5S6_ANGAN
MYEMNIMLQVGRESVHLARIQSGCLTALRRLHRAPPIKWLHWLHFLEAGTCVSRRHRHWLPGVSWRRECRPAHSSA